MRYVRQSLATTLNRIFALLQESRGVVLVESVVAITILAAVGTAVLMGVRTAHTASDVVKVHSNAETLARNQMEYAFAQTYCKEDVECVPLDAPGAYVSIEDSLDILFTVKDGVTVTAQAVKYTEGDPDIVTDKDIQKVVVTITQDGQDVLVLNTLRVND